MIAKYAAPALLALGVFSFIGCSAGQFQAGRQALLRGDSEAALGYLSGAAEQSPNYVNVIEDYQESIWTYLGRAQYETRRYQEARRSLEKAVAANRDEGMALLYLGLVEIRTGDGVQGAKHIGSGLKSLEDWIEYMNRTRPFQAFWDPLRVIRKQIDQGLQIIGARDFNRDQLISTAESVGKAFEEELDRVRQDERRQIEIDNDGGDSSPK